MSRATAAVARDFCALIPAAGFSSRMGAFKPLLPLGGVTVVAHLIHLFHTVGVDEIFVVTGHRGDELGACLAGAGVTLVENPQFAEGMFASIRTGMARVPTHCRGIFLLPVDIPLVRPATLHLLMEAFTRLSPAEADATIHPVFAGRRGHPPLLPASLIPAIMKHSGGGGLQALLEAPGALALNIPVPDRFIHMDMDRPEGYAAVQRDLDAHTIPTVDECELLLTAIRAVKPAILSHSRRVATAATAIGRALNQVGGRLNLALLQAGALLHDLAKGEKNHAQKGGQYLHRLGFVQVAEIVAQHDDLHMASGAGINEAAVVFIADKHINGDKPVTLEERFALALRHFGADPEARSNILRRRDTARRLADRIESVTGKKLIDFVLATDPELACP